MKVKHKVVTLSVVGLIGMILIAIVGIMTLKSDGEMFDHFEEVIIPKTTTLLRLQGDIHNIARRGYAIVARQNMDFETQKKEVARLASVLKEAHEAGEARVVEFRKYPLTPHGKELWAEIETLWADWSKYDDQFLAAIEKALANPTPEEFQKLYVTMGAGNAARAATSGKMVEKMKEINAAQRKLTSETIDEAQAQQSFDYKLMIGIIVISVLALGGVTYSVMVSVIKPLNQLRDMQVAIAETLDLTRRIKRTNNDELGEMANAFDAMMDKFQGTFKNIRERVDRVGSTAASVATGAEQISQSSASQSSSASAMAASIEQMSVSINTVSSSATDAQNIAQEAGRLSQQGSQIIEQTRDGMTTIAQNVSSASRVIETLGEESRQITNVVNVIKEVADQTNLLALNAAIEAARAGDQGRGFAVVADEVRKLAERTAQSTIDIGNMVGKIQTSANEAVVEMGKVVKEVEAGQTLAQDAGERMRSISSEAVKVSSAVTEISDALKEQSQASHDVARHVESIAQMTDENHAAVEEASSSVQELNRLAEEVTEALSQFKVTNKDS